MGSYFPFPRNVLDRPENPVLVPDLAEDHALVPVAGDFLELAQVIARAVGALHLAVAEQVQLRQQNLGQQFKAVRNVIAPVVAVGEMEGVDVPLVRSVAGVR